MNGGVVLRLVSPLFVVGTPGDTDDDTVLITFEGPTETVFVRLTGAEAADLSDELAAHHDRRELPDGTDSSLDRTGGPS